MSRMTHRVLITGGRRGLGRHLALHLAGTGHVVCLLGRTPREALDPEVQKAVAECLVADPADRASLDAALAQVAAHVPPFDVVIGNAAIRPAGRLLLDYDADEIRQMIEVNLTAPALLARATLPGMNTLGYGRVILIGSRAAFGRGPREAVYAASKAGLVALVEALAGEVDGRTVTVNAICPGRFSADSRHNRAGGGTVLGQVLARTDWLIESHVNGRIVPVAPWRHRAKDARRAMVRAVRLLLPRG